jgi:pimeloyl-ACP methyl ester carboxylesterase
MPYLTHDNLNFFYLDRGSGVPFFFHHGLGGETEKVFALVELPPGFRLVGLDCRGHGKTNPMGPSGKLRFNCFADDLIALMDYLHIQGAVVGGSSMGAGVALNCALRYPQQVRGLVLLRPAWLDTPTAGNVRLFGEIAQLLREHGPEKGRKTFTRSTAFTSVMIQCPDVADSLLALFSDPRALETVARLELIPQDVPNRDRAEWRRIAAPTLVLANRGDPVHPYEFAEILAREIPGAQLHELTPKSVSVEQYTTELRQALARFLLKQFSPS